MLAAPRRAARRRALPHTRPRMPGIYVDEDTPQPRTSCWARAASTAHAACGSPRRPRASFSRGRRRLTANSSGEWSLASANIPWPSRATRRDDPTEQRARRDPWARRSYVAAWRLQMRWGRPAGLPDRRSRMAAGSTRRKAPTAAPVSSARARSPASRRRLAAAGRRGRADGGWRPAGSRRAPRHAPASARRPGRPRRASCRRSRHR